MATNRRRIARKKTGIITDKAVELYKAGDREALQDELNLGYGDRNPLCPHDDCWNLLACSRDPANMKRAELIRDRIEAIIEAEGGTDGNEQD